MGARKRLAAERRKKEKKQQYFAVLNNCPTSPRKMRLVADSIRGMEVNKALDVLKFSSKEASRRVEKLLLSAIANWQAKNEGVRLEESDLYVKRIMVDSGRILKRLRPAPQGRAHRIRKRSNHVTIYVDRKESVVEENLNQ
jgi:large subunit ribosomal protein L22